jgi:hypothetical protein
MQWVIGLCTTTRSFLTSCCLLMKIGYYRFVRECRHHEDATTSDDNTSTHTTNDVMEVEEEDMDMSWAADSLQSQVVPLYGTTGRRVRILSGANDRACLIASLSHTFLAWANLNKVQYCVCFIE